MLFPISADKALISQASGDNINNFKFKYTI